jgi:hypothetical protein
MKISYNAILVGVCSVSAAVLFTVACGKKPAGDLGDAALSTIRPEAIRADMRFLADDLLEGRGTAMRGHEIAAKFMAAEFEQMGLAPAGDNGTYFQSVPLRSGRPDEVKTTLTFVRGGKTEKLVYRKDFITVVDPGRTESTVEAPVVFVGDGVTAPDQSYDDYKGIDVKGKIVAFSLQAPNFESSLKARYTDPIVKQRNAVEHGAVGMILIMDPIEEDVYPFAKFVRDLDFPQFNWLDRDGKPNDYFPELKGQAILSMEATKKLFQGSGHTAEEVFADIKAGKPKSFVLPLSAKIRNVTKSEDAHSPNVAAKIEGSDPNLKNEYVVFTAHLDHFGIGKPINGDGIYNGALDNGSGSAVLLEVARAFQKSSAPPRRSLLFVSVTGEEEGLLGSDYFAHYPTVPNDAIVADINMDEDVMLWPLQDVVAYGEEHSSLHDVVKKAAERLHLEVSPDPAPEEAFFIRSDQYSFVKQGAPSIFPTAGFMSNDPKINPAAIYKKWEAERYHMPGDDMQQPGLLFDEAVKYAQFIFLCGDLVANDPQRPAWNKGDFFDGFYRKKIK